MSKILIASNLFPKVTVYDTTKPPSALSKLIKFGVTVEANDGSVLYETEQPRLSPIIQWGIMLTVVGGFSYLIYRSV